MYEQKIDKAMTKFFDDITSEELEELLKKTGFYEDDDEEYGNIFNNY